MSEDNLSGRTTTNADHSFASMGWGKSHRHSTQPPFVLASCDLPERRALVRPWRRARILRLAFTWPFSEVVRSALVSCACSSSQGSRTTHTHTHTQSKRSTHMLAKGRPWITLHTDELPLLTQQLLQITPGQGGGGGNEKRKNNSLSKQKRRRCLAWNTALGNEHKNQKHSAN